MERAKSNEKEAGDRTIEMNVTAPIFWPTDGSTFLPSIESRNETASGQRIYVLYDDFGKFIFVSHKQTLPL